MISRRTTLIVADVYVEAFRHSNRHTTNAAKLYDFLFRFDYAAEFCALARKIARRNHGASRSLKDFILQLHTGESLKNLGSRSLSPEVCAKLGQEYLHKLTEDILTAAMQGPRQVPGKRVLLSSLELDGYRYRDSKLLAPEEDVIDVEEERGLLEALATSLQLDDRQTALYHLELSETHYIDQKWDDSIGNSRKYLKKILEDVAKAHSQRIKGSPLQQKFIGRPVKIREYLEAEGLVSGNEKGALAKVYGLLSATGGHPYMAENDQARLLRHLALTFSQFVMLRLEGALP